MKFPQGIRDLSELPADFKEAPIGPRSEVIETITRIFPPLRFSSETGVTIETETYAIEIGIGGENICTSIMFCVYGNGSDAVNIIQKISERLEIRAWDGTQFLDDASNPESGFEHYKEYRDKVLKDVGADGAQSKINELPN